MDRKKGLKIIALMAVLAMIVSGYLVYLHYKPEASSFCDISATLNCDVVNKSIYSELFGLPVSGLGLLVFLGIFILALIGIKDKKFDLFGVKVNSDLIVKGLLFISIWNLLFALYLVYIEAFVLYTYCIMCILLDVLIIIILIYAILLNKKR